MPSGHTQCEADRSEYFRVLFFILWYYQPPPPYCSHQSRIKAGVFAHLYTTIYENIYEYLQQG